ncbi:hypothetical protein MHF_1324 [Mycoplasma haemofelis Ohio2]|uniref:Uncharacterized protein n=1 Tax=Mycoplasma haemofelis (strain Ohio2) TaxID=859194 RepID=F6FG62_MYCHI|nr:hypothetical protein MHF_1324 [Mycoplasma haemofelis Ohio2]
MSFSITKAAAGLGAVSGASGLGYLAAKNFSTNEDKKTSISQLFEKEGRVLLVRGQDTAQWNARWKAYVGENGNVWKLGDYDAKKGNADTAPDSFIGKCVDSSKVRVSGIEDPLYLEVVKHCSKEFSISDLISKSSKFVALNTADNQEDGEWKNAWKSYLADNRDGQDNPWGLSSNNWNSVKTQKENLPTDFKTTCNTKKNETVLWEKDSKFLNFIRWCSKAK